MSWENFCELNKVGPRYQQVDFESDVLMPDEMRKGGIEWVNRPSSLILSGAAGRGKTHFLHCLIRSLLNRCDLSAIRLYKAKNIDDKLLLNFKEYGSSSHFIQHLVDIPALFIDDFGVERPTERMVRDIYEIIDGRYEWNRLTVITTNLSNADIKKTYGERIHSRLKEFRWIQFNGKDLRG